MRCICTVWMVGCCIGMDCHCWFFLELYAQCWARNFAFTSDTAQADLLFGFKTTSISNSAASTVDHV